MWLKDGSECADLGSDHLESEGLRYVPRSTSYSRRNPINHVLYNQNSTVKATDRMQSFTALAIYKPVVIFDVAQGYEGLIRTANESSIVARKWLC